MKTMNGVNRVIISGRVSSEPKTRVVSTGNKVSNFSIATSESYTDKNGEKKTVTEWHSIVLWKGLAEVTENFIQKGDLVYLEGRLKTRAWEKDGVKRFITEIVAESITTLYSKGGKPKPQPESNEVGVVWI